MEVIIINLITIFLVGLLVSILLTFLYATRTCKFFYEKIDIISDKIVEKLYSYANKSHRRVHGK